MTREDMVWIWLSRVRGLGPGRARQLVEHFGGEEKLLAASEAELREKVGGVLAGNIWQAKNAEEIRQHVRGAWHCGQKIMTPASPEYPEALREIYDPPCALYYRGDVSLLRERGVTLIGSRRHTQYGARVTAQFSRELAQAGLVIVSGLAEGLGAIANRAALDACGKTIAVLGNGLDVAYPAMLRPLQEEIAQKGLLLSECPPGTRAGRGTLLPRNRLLAALSEATIVTEAGEKSGTMHVVELAADYGREVLAVPGNIDSPASIGVNRLLRNGAAFALGSADVLEALGLAAEEGETAQETARASLSEEEKLVLEALALEPLSFDEIAARTKLSVSKLNSLLTMLELKGIIDQAAARVYATKS